MNLEAFMKTRFSKGDEVTVDARLLQDIVADNKKLEEKLNNCYDKNDEIHSTMLEQALLIKKLQKEIQDKNATIAKFDGIKRKNESLQANLHMLSYRRNSAYDTPRRVDLRT